VEIIFPLIAAIREFSVASVAEIVNLDESA
jgi:hypothetical protein